MEVAFRHSPPTRRGVFEDDWEVETMSDFGNNSSIIINLRILAERVQDEDVSSKTIEQAATLMHRAAERMLDLIDELQLLHERIKELEAEKDDWPEE